MSHHRTEALSPVTHTFKKLGLLILALLFSANTALLAQ